MKIHKRLFTALFTLALSLCLISSIWAASFEQTIEFEGNELTVSGDVDTNGVVSIEKVLADGEDVTEEFANNDALASALSPLVYDVDAARAEAFGIGGGNEAALEGESPEGESAEGESPEGESAEGESGGGESGGSAAEPVVYDNYITESASYDTYTFDGSTYGAEEGSYLTVVVDGVEIDPADLDGEYENVEFVVTPQIPAFVDGYESAYRTGLYVDEEGLQEEYSVLQAVAGTYDDDTASDIVIISEGPNFEGVIVTGGEYTIDDLTILANGNGSNDFAGVGAGIAVGGNAKVTVNNYDFLANGVIRHGMFIGGDDLADPPVLTVNGGLIVGQNPQLDDGTTLYETTSGMSMSSSPWMLGIEPTPEVRTQLMASTGTGNYNDCVILSSGWGIVSSDAVDAPAEWGDYTIQMNLDNCILDFTGTSGYVSYAIGATHNNFTDCVIGNAIAQGLIGDEIARAKEDYDYDIDYESGVELDENGDAYNTTYALIVANETAGGTFDGTAYTGEYGVMYHKTNNVSYVPGETDNSAEELPADGYTLLKDSEFNTNGAALLIKACTPVINVENTLFDSKTGVIVQLATCDDPGMGSPYFSEALDLDAEVEADPNYDPYDYNVKDQSIYSYNIENMINDVQVSFKDCTGDTALYGNFYNSISVPTTGEGMTWWGQNLILDFDNCEINGDATSSKALHNNYSGFFDADGNEIEADTIEEALAGGAVEGRITSDNATYLGGMTNYNAPAVNNGVWVKLENGSVWTPQGQCYLTVLDIDDSSSVNGTITVDGKTVEGSGHYAGEIVVTGDTDVQVIPAENFEAEFDMTHPIAGDIHVIVDYEADDNGDIQLISVVDPELGEDILPVQDEDTIAMIIELVKQQ